jgi:hypothetical protein
MRYRAIVIMYRLTRETNKYNKNAIIFIDKL